MSRTGQYPSLFSVRSSSLNPGLVELVEIVLADIRPEVRDVDAARREVARQGEARLPVQR